MVFNMHVAQNYSPENFSTPLYGALDLGTNTCRLLIAKESSLDKKIQLVDSFSRVIRFGEDLQETGVLSASAMDRAFSVLEECARRLHLHRVNRVRCVATAACRKAKNASEFVEKVFDRTGLMLEVISSQEESKLAVAGCLDLMTPTRPFGLVLDIGGGSTEVVWIQVFEDEKFKVLDCVSLPYGVLALSDTLCSMEKKQEISRLISFEMNEFALRNDMYNLIDQGHVQMIGASGTVTTLAAIVLNLPRYDRGLVHQTHLETEDLHRVIDHLWGMSPSERLAHPCIGPQRAEFIMGGLAIFQGIYEILTVNPVVVADRGVREGILKELMAESQGVSLYPSSDYSSAA